MSEYFYIFLDFALVFGGCVLLLIGAIYAGFYFVVRRTGKRLMTEVDKVVTERIEKERKMNDRLSRLTHLPSLAKRRTND